MEFRNLLNIKNRDELRQWLLENHNKELECWVVAKRGRPVDDETFWYIDAVEEAMCFGWIDSTTKKMDSGVTAQRLAPRRKGSLWSELNKERFRRMERFGQMTNAGRAVLPDMSEKGFVIDKDILNALQADAEVWENFRCNFVYNRITKEVDITNNNVPIEKILPIPIYWLDKKLKENGMLKSKECKISYQGKTGLFLKIPVCIYP